MLKFYMPFLADSWKIYTRAVIGCDCVTYVSWDRICTRCRVSQTLNARRQLTDRQILADTKCSQTAHRQADF